MCSWRHELVYWRVCQLWTNVSCIIFIRYIAYACMCRSLLSLSGHVSALLKSTMSLTGPSGPIDWRYKPISGWRASSLTHERNANIINIQGHGRRRLLVLRRLGWLQICANGLPGHWRVYRCAVANSTRISPCARLLARAATGWCT